MIYCKGSDYPYGNTATTGAPSTEPHSAGAYAIGRVPYSTYPIISSGTVHTGGANWLATDGHVKFLRPAQVSGGYGEQPNSSFVQDGVTPSGAYAPCGTGSMQDTNGDMFSLTFSAT